MDSNIETADGSSFVGPQGSFASIPDSTATKKQQVDKNSLTTNANVQLLQNGISESIAENAALGKEIVNFMSKLGISCQSLPRDIKENLKKISLILKYEGLAAFDETALSIRMEQNKIQQKQQDREERRLKNKYESVIEKYASLQKRCDYVRDALISIDQEIAKAQADYKKQYSGHKLNSARLNDYKKTAGKLEAELESLGSEELQPDRIMDKYKSFVEMKGHLAELNQALRQYKDLPPNLLQAKAMIEAKELEYKAISQWFMERNF